MLNQPRIVQSQDHKEIWDHLKIYSQRQIKVECLVEVHLPILRSIIGITFMLITVTEQDIKAMQKILLLWAEQIFILEEKKLLNQF